MKLLSSDTVANIDQYRQQFQLQNPTPFAHVVMDGFLTESFCQGLLDEFPSFDKKFAMNENGEVGRKAVNERVRNLGKSFKKMDNLAKSSEFLQFVGKVTGIDGLIYDPLYFGGGTHENLSGQSLDPHVDFTEHPITGNYRRLNLIVYLNHTWESEWGGNIELHKNPQLPLEKDEIISVRPLFNRAVVFETTHTSWHGFPAINIPDTQPHISRKSFALYFYTKAPAKSFKLPHSTIYVDRHLPSNIKAGSTLSEHDYAEIQRLLHSRDRHLQRLYNNISVLMGKEKQSRLRRLPGRVLGIIWALSLPYRKLRDFLRAKKNK